MFEQHDWKAKLARLTRLDPSYCRMPATSADIEAAKQRAHAMQLHLPDDVLDFYRYTNGFDINGTYIVPLPPADWTLFDIQVDLADHVETAYGMAYDDTLRYEPNVNLYRLTSSSADVLHEYPTFAALLDDVLTKQLEVLQALSE